MNQDLKTRRDFLRTTVLGGALSWTVPTFLSRTFQVLGAEAANADHVLTGRDSPILVVLQLAGGNDGLNTVVPRNNDHYHRARARLGLPTKELLRINDSLGFHPSLGGFRSLLEAGRLAIVQGAGYPNPNRSHFRSMEIWQTAGDSKHVEKYGWIGRYFDNACHGCDPSVGVNVGRQMPQAFTAKQPTGISIDAPSRGNGGPQPAGADDRMSTPEQDDERSGETIADLSGPSSASGTVLDFLDRTALDARVSSAQVRDITGKARNAVDYPTTRLAQSLKLVAQLIAGGLPARVFYVSQGGYDTHIGQAPNQARLLQELGDSVKAFVDDLSAQGHLDRVLGMSFSEFGRRVTENASGGTDHGAAGPMFLFGHHFSTPLLGKYPSLAPSDLLDGDLKFNVDFRSVYASVLEDWMKTSSEKVLGRRFERIKWA